MHPDDLMTPKERMAALANGRPADRYPVMPLVGSVSAGFAGLTQRERGRSAQNKALSLIRTYERLGHDSVSVRYGLHGLGLALGSRLSDPEDSVPSVLEHVLKDLDKLEDLDFSPAEPRRDRTLQMKLEAAEMVRDKIGHEVGVGFSLTGPLTSACSVFQVEYLLRAFRKNPERLHRLLRLCTEALKDVALECFRRELGLSLADPIASGTVIRKEQYVEFVKPYSKEIIDLAHKHGRKVSYHICGQTMGILEDMLEAGADFISLDNVVDLEKAKGVLGGKVCILGNVDPVKVLMQGSRQEVEEAVKANYQTMSDNLQGYILSSGCDIPAGTPLENMDAFMAAARRYGRLGV